MPEHVSIRVNPPQAEPAPTTTVEHARLLSVETDPLAGYVLHWALLSPDDDQPTGTVVHQHLGHGLGPRSELARAFHQITGLPAYMAADYDWQAILKNRECWVLVTQATSPLGMTVAVCRGIVAEGPR